LWPRIRRNRLDRVEPGWSLS